MADAAFSATPLGNLINKSTDAQGKTGQNHHTGGRRQKTDTAARMKPWPRFAPAAVYLRDPLIRHLSPAQKQEADRQKGKRAGRRNATRAEPCAKYSNVWIAPISRWLTPGLSLPCRTRTHGRFALPAAAQANTRYRRWPP